VSIRYLESLRPAASRIADLPQPQGEARIGLKGGEQWMGLESFEAGVGAVDRGEGGVGLAALGVDLGD
jgi:hypothetical protein